MLSSDAGVLLLRNVEKQLGLAHRLSACLKDKRDPDFIKHTVEEMLRLRMLAIAAGYEDANDFDRLRYDPIFKMAAGRSPEAGDPLCSQPTMSRLENAPSRTELGRMMLAMIDQFCSSYRRAPKAIILDIDDTFDAVHGKQQLSLFNAHYDERCFLPIHIYEGTSGKPVAMILREGKTPSGREVRTILKHVIKRIRAHWPKVHILVRGDSHYGRHEAMEWCESQGVDYVFGFGGNAVLEAMTGPGRCAVRRTRDKRRRSCAVSASCAMAPRAGSASAVSWPDWKRPQKASTSATSSPRSRARPSISMRPSTAPAARRRTSSSCTRPSSPPIAPRVAIRAPTRSA